MDLEVESANARVSEDDIAIRMSADDQNVVVVAAAAAGGSRGFVDDEDVLENRAVL